MYILHISGIWKHIIHSSLRILIVYSFDFNHSREYEIVSLYNFDLHTYNNKGCYLCFHVLISCLYISRENNYQSFTHFIALSLLMIIIILHFKINLIFLRSPYMHIICLDQIYLPFPSLQFLTYPCWPPNVICSVFTHIVSTSYYQYIHLCRPICWSKGCLPGMASLKKLTLRPAASLNYQSSSTEL